MIVEWPHPGLAPRVIDLDIDPQTRSAGASVTGFEQVEEGVNARWRGKLEFNNLKAGMVPAYRAMRAKLRGRANVLRVPLFDAHYWPSDVSLGIEGAPHSDGTPFSDLALYVTDDATGLTVTGLRGAKEITLDFGDYGAIFEAGLYFGVDEELYMATSVEFTGTVATIGFEPGLRQDHTDGIFRLRPRLLMRLMTDQSGRLALEYGLTGTPTLELEEVLPDELGEDEV